MCVANGERPPKVPMIPAVLIGLLAISRLGAIHAVVFGGFAAQALAQRIDASRPKAILTASCGIDGNKPPIPYRDFLLAAARLAQWETPKTIIWQRDGPGELSWHPLQRQRGERSWNRLVRSAAVRNPDGPGVACVPFRSGDPCYIIYTSGTTGLPKGVVRDTGGHAVGLALSMRTLFGIQGPGDVMACLSDLGWVVGHSFTLYGPLLVGAATVLYEGKPVGTPDASAFWRLVAEYRVNALFTAPTALRAIRHQDPANSHLTRIGEAGGLRSLRALFLAGERSEPAIVSMYQDLLGRYGGGEAGARVVDNWWSSESGSPISGISLAPERALARLRGRTGGPTRPLAIKPGSAGKPMPGFDVRVVDDEGNELGRGKMGNIVLKTPLAPTAFRTLWQDEERFYKGYFKRFEGRWLDTGDAGIVDLDGYVHIMARSGESLFFFFFCNLVLLSVLLTGPCVFCCQTTSSTWRPTALAPAPSNKPSHRTRASPRPAWWAFRTRSKASCRLPLWWRRLRRRTDSTTTTTTTSKTATRSCSPRSKGWCAHRSGLSPRWAA